MTRNFSGTIVSIFKLWRQGSTKLRPPSNFLREREEQWWQKKLTTAVGTTPWHVSLAWKTDCQFIVFPLFPFFVSVQTRESCVVLLFLWITWYYYYYYYYYYCFYYYYYYYYYYYEPSTIWRWSIASQTREQSLEGNFQKGQFHHVIMSVGFKGRTRWRH